jgi:hypothetical protein
VRCVSDGGETADACARRILARLVEVGWLAPEPPLVDADAVRTGGLPGEEDHVRDRLVDLGHID